MADDKLRSGIWLEVAEVQFDENEIKVQLKGDRQHPKPAWWLVDPAAVVTSKAGKPSAYDTYCAILHEMDKKRVALAYLGWASIPSDKDAKQAKNQADRKLRCIALRFQSSDLGSRTP